eukprot:GEMP01002537.1.p1 GENE.GEMP01002537.1~~GEMP01002537.1.p1  ORF type:complete len:1359 (+),score=323.96 GEMP01002537.1:105-4181(+)
MSNNLGDLCTHVDNALHVPLSYVPQEAIELLGRCARRRTSLPPAWQKISAIQTASGPVDVIDEYGRFDSVEWLSNPQVADMAMVGGRRFFYPSFCSISNGDPSFDDATYVYVGALAAARALRDNLNHQKEEANRIKRTRAATGRAFVEQCIKGPVVVLPMCAIGFRHKYTPRVLHREACRRHPLVITNVTCGVRIFLRLLYVEDPEDYIRDARAEYSAAQVEFHHLPQSKLILCALFEGGPPFHFSGHINDVVAAIFGFVPDDTAGDPQLPRNTAPLGISEYASRASTVPNKWTIVQVDCTRTDVLESVAGPIPAQCCGRKSWEYKVGDGVCAFCGLDCRAQQVCLTCGTAYPCCRLCSQFFPAPLKRIKKPILSGSQPPSTPPDAAHQSAVDTTAGDEDDDLLPCISQRQYHAISAVPHNACWETSESHSGSEKCISDRCMIATFVVHLAMTMLDYMADNERINKQLYDVLARLVQPFEGVSAVVAAGQSRSTHCVDVPIALVSSRFSAHVGLGERAPTLIPPQLAPQTENLLSDKYGPALLASAASDPGPSPFAREDVLPAMTQPTATSDIPADPPLLSSTPASESSPILCRSVAPIQGPSTRVPVTFSDALDALDAANAEPEDALRSTLTKSLPLFPSAAYSSQTATLLPTRTTPDATSSPHASHSNQDSPRLTRSGSASPGLPRVPHPQLHPVPSPNPHSRLNPTPNPIPSRLQDSPSAPATTMARQPIEQNWGATTIHQGPKDNTSESPLLPGSSARDAHAARDIQTPPSNMARETATPQMADHNKFIVTMEDAEFAPPLPGVPLAAAYELIASYFNARSNSQSDKYFIMHPYSTSRIPLDVAQLTHPHCPLTPGTLIRPSSPTFFRPTLSDILGSLHTMSIDSNADPTEFARVIRLIPPQPSIAPSLIAFNGVPIAFHALYHMKLNEARILIARNPAPACDAQTKPQPRGTASALFDKSDPLSLLEVAALDCGNSRAVMLLVCDILDSPNSIIRERLIWRLCMEKRVDRVQMLMAHPKTTGSNRGSVASEALRISIEGKSVALSNICADELSDIDVVPTKDPFARTPLMLAFAHDMCDLAVDFLKRGASGTATDNCVVPVLFYAVRCAMPKRLSTDAEESMSRDDVLTLLIEQKADVNTVFQDGRPALHVCLGDILLEWARALVANGADIEQMDSRGFRALHYAFLMDENLLRTLLKMKAYVNVQNFVGDTPLRLAVQHRRVRICEMLCESNANPNAQNRAQCSAMDAALRLIDDHQGHEAESNRAEEIAGILRQYGGRATKATAPAGAMKGPADGDPSSPRLRLLPQSRPEMDTFSTAISGTVEEVSNDMFVMGGRAASLSARKDNSPPEP